MVQLTHHPFFFLYLSQNRQNGGRVVAAAVGSNYARPCVCMAQHVHGAATTVITVKLAFVIIIIISIN